MNGALSPSVTVAVLTYNGERYLDALLTAVERQVYDGPLDVLVIDSGSRDGTLPIVSRHPSVRLHEIPNSEFGHGRTRNLAATLARGEIVAYLTHDAVPSSDLWLAELVHPFVDDERIAAVIGKQVARRSAPPILKYEIRRMFDYLGPDQGITVVHDRGRVLSEEERHHATFYSDANSAARRSILTGPVPYRDVAYSEDQLLGRDLFDGGYRRAYAPKAAVEHSNDTTLRSFGSRVAADVMGLRLAGTAVEPLSRFGVVRQWIKWSAADSALILVDRDYSGREKFRWILSNPWYHAVKWRAYRRASRASM